MRDSKLVMQLLRNFCPDLPLILTSFLIKKKIHMSSKTKQSDPGRGKWKRGDKRGTFLNKRIKPN
jgi:hypothetical protein